MALIANIMALYVIYVAKWITREIRDWEISTDIVVVFPFMLKKINLEFRSVKAPRY